MTNSTKIQLLQLVMHKNSDEIDIIIKNYNKIKLLFEEDQSEKIKYNHINDYIADETETYTMPSAPSQSVSLSGDWTQPMNYVTEPSKTLLWNCLDGADDCKTSCCCASSVYIHTPEEVSNTCQETNTEKPLSILEKIRNYIDKNIKTNDSLVKLYAEESAIRDNVINLLSNKLDKVFQEIDKDIGFDENYVEPETPKNILDAYDEKLKGKTVPNYDSSDSGVQKLFDALFSPNKIKPIEQPNQFWKIEKDLISNEQEIKPVEIKEQKLSDNNTILNQCDREAIESLQCTVDNFLKKYILDY